MDIQQLTSLARSMVLEWGMSEKLGFVRYSGVDTQEQYLPDREYSEETAKIIDEEIRRFASEAYADAEAALNEHWDAVVAVAEALLKHEMLSADEVRQLMDGKPLTKPTVSDLLDAEMQKKESAPPSPPENSADDDQKFDPGIMPSPA